MIDVANNFYEIYKVYQKCLPNIIFNTDHCLVEDKDIYFFDYWKNIFLKICQHYKLDLIKNKSIMYFINNIKYGHQITLSKKLIII